MIDTLQCGNWIQYKDLTAEQKQKGAYWIAEGINQTRDLIYVRGKWLPANKYQPIDIKWGWLKRLNFVEAKMDEDFFTNSESLHELDSKVYVYSISQFRHFIWGQNMHLVMGYGVDDFYATPMPRVRWVHQVQNLIGLFDSMRENSMFNPEENDNSKLTNALYGDPN